MSEKHQHNPTAPFIGDIVYGGHDGIITTFAIIAGSVGAGLSAITVVILGIANVVADAISMAASSYLARKSELHAFKFQRAVEEWETANEPDEERTEVREILRSKGYEGKDLDQLVGLITKNPKFWVDFMMNEELGIFGSKDSGRPWRTALVTFMAFVAAGILPLIPYFFTLGRPASDAFPFAIMAALVALFVIGILRSRVALKKWYVNCGEVLIVGIIAGSSAYFIGAFLQSVLQN